MYTKICVLQKLFHEICVLTGIMIAQPMPLAPVKHTKVVVEKKITRRIDHQERSETKKSTLEYKEKGTLASLFISHDFVD